MDNVTESTDEPPRDPGAGRAHHSYTDKDFEGEAAPPLSWLLRFRCLFTVPSGLLRGRRFICF